jgi:RNA polymerase sigma factor (TIGR02999 family)
MGDVTRILEAVNRGEAELGEHLVPLVYDELRRMAAAHMAREKPGHTLQATALVHEAYLRLVGNGPNQWANRRHFFGAAAEAMRRILVESARRKATARRGSGAQRVELHDTDLVIEPPSNNVLAVNEALASLAASDPEAAELVKLRYFVGLTQEQIGELLGVSRRDADRLWAFARAWLFQALKETGEVPKP